MNSTLEKMDTKSKVKQLLNDGLTAQEIADQIGVALSTVYHHKNNIESVSKKSAKVVDKNSEDHLEDYKSSVKELKSENDKLQEQIESLLGKNKALEQRVEDFAEKLESKEQQHRASLQRIKDRDEQIKALKHIGARIMRILHSNALVNVIMILLSIGIAHGVTAPILIQNGIVDYVAQPLAICADLAAYILLSRGVRGGWFFAFLAGVQVLIVTGGLDWIDVLTVEQIAATKGVMIELHYDVPLYVKSLALAAVVIGAIGKFGELIHESQKQTPND